MKLTAFSCLLLLMIVGCSPSPKPITIDNPTDADIKIKFKQTDTLLIPANQSKTINLVFGKETVFVNDDVHQIDLDSDKEYILNPSLENLYVQNIPYFFTPEGQDMFFDQYGTRKSKVEGIEVNGDFEKIENRLVITKNWTFGLDQEASPRGSIGLGSNKDFMFVKKIHRKKDLMRAIDAQLLESFIKMGKSWKDENPDN